MHLKKNLDWLQGSSHYYKLHTKKCGNFWYKFSWQNLIQKGQEDKSIPLIRVKRDNLWYVISHWLYGFLAQYTNKTVMRIWQLEIEKPNYSHYLLNGITRSGVFMWISVKNLKICNGYTMWDVCTIDWPKEDASNFESQNFEGP